VRHNVRFSTFLLNTTPEDSMKKIAKPGLGQGFSVHRKAEPLISELWR